MAPGAGGESTDGGGEAVAFEGTVDGRAADLYFLDSCAGCHGTDRWGATGPALLAERLTQSDEYYFDVIANGKPGTVMPPWGGQLASDHSPYVWADAVFAEQPNVITVFDKEPPFGVVGVIEAGMRTLHPEFTDDGAFVYVSDWDGNVVRVYDAETLEQVAEIPNIVTPTGIFNVARRLETLGH